MKDKLSTESYKGVRDFYPEDEAIQQYIFATMKDVAESSGYIRYDASILEPSELYRSKGAENAEIINDQTYTFIDRGDREVTLRPEMTPTVTRMVAAKRRELGFPLRWYSIPNVFRYERPQRGRLREHWQLNVDLFGSESFAADAEVMYVAYQLLTSFGGKESDFAIRISSRAFIDALALELELSDADTKKLLALLDRKDKMEKEEFEAGLAELNVPAERLSPQHVPADVQKVLDILSGLGVGNAVFDPSIVRGFNYYTGTVFEIFDTHPDNNRAVCGGGRYDNLFDLFGQEKIPAVGFGLSDVRVRDFLAARGLLPEYRPSTHVYLAVASDAEVPHALQIAQELRAEGVNVAVDFADKKLADQIKNAVKNGVPYLIVIGQNEITSGNFMVRALVNGQETPMSRAELSSFFLNTSTDHGASR